MRYCDLSHYNKSVNRICLYDLDIKQDMCLWNTDAPGGNKVKYGKKF